jgi:hypothetical protein
MLRIMDIRNVVFITSLFVYTHNMYVCRVNTTLLNALKLRLNVFKRTRKPSLNITYLTGHPRPHYILMEAP